VTKTRGRKSRDTVPLSTSFLKLFFRCRRVVLLRSKILYSTLKKKKKKKLANGFPYEDSVVSKEQDHCKKKAARIKSHLFPRQSIHRF
jgi:hypothetical protein